MKDENDSALAPAISRRDFVKGTAAAGGAALLSGNAGFAAPPEGGPGTPLDAGPSRRLPDLRPARWVWYPSGRTLPNTFVLFRRELELRTAPRRATGWVSADSRYLLSVNGKRVQWGPAPCDPRFAEADPVDLTGVLAAGRNVLGAQVLYYGHGEGTWPMGKPGFLFWLEVETEDGRVERVVSDAAWRCMLARSWRPGQYKRWYLRALQEEFDARAYPFGWSAPEFAPNGDWLAAMPLECPPDKPPVSSSYRDYLLDTQGDPAVTELRPRAIPLLREEPVPASRLAESFRITWRRPPEEYFECLTPDAFEAERNAPVRDAAPGAWRVELDGERAAALTFELEEQVVGFPFFTVEAPAGTIVELMVHEAHEVGGPPLLNTHFHAWTRFTCREGINEFETFDFESCRWMQLHVRGARGVVTVRDVGVRRRLYPWPNAPRVACSDPAVQRVVDASINTLYNSAQETLVDGMGRERQQYSGDVGHQAHAIYLAFGEYRLPARYLETFSQGLTSDGYFLDCWPAYDRLSRLAQRQVQLTEWGPLLDHGVGFVFDCFHHYLYTGDLQALREPYPRLLRFAEYLRGLRGRDGLLPVEGLGVPTVWIDHNAYRRQRHKQCAFSLYAAAALEHALAPIARAFGDGRTARAAGLFGRELLGATSRRFWSPRRGVLVNNLPWLGEEREARLCDRSLATSILFDQCPGGRTAAAVAALADEPPEMGLSYPANAGWRLWALAKEGRADVILKDLRGRWAAMSSVGLNNTLQEDWTALPDSGSQWSHCPVAPLYVLYMSVAGIRPLAPGFARCEVRPQPGDLERLELTAHTPLGPAQFASRGPKGGRDVTVELPAGCEGELVVDARERVDLAPLPGAAPAGTRRYRLAPGWRAAVRLEHT